MSKLHLNQIKKNILDSFSGLIDMSDCQDIGGTTCQDLLISRSLAAFAIKNTARIDPITAAYSVTDGAKDNGIDALYCDDDERRLYLVQSKWKKRSVGEPANADIKKFIKGIKDIFNLRYDRFNEKILKKSEEIEKAVSDASYKYIAILAYPTTSPLTQSSKNDISDLLTEINDTSELLEFRILDQAQLYKFLTLNVTGSPIIEDIEISHWGRIDVPYVGYYGRINIDQIAGWWEKYGAQLFQKNLRGVIGDTDVNNEIRKSLETRPELLWYLNNGITIIAKNIQRAGKGAGGTDNGTFHCEDINIVNGAQTVGTIGKYWQKDLDSQINAYVQIRLISLNGTEEGFGDLITRTNNRQNRIENRDFVTQDPNQARIRDELAIEKIRYKFNREENSERTDTSFDLIESTTALACASGETQIVVQLKREIGKLWEDINKSPYRILFNENTTGMYVWRCVQLQRIIDRTLDSFGITLKGKGKIVKDKIAVHGNRLIAAMVFLEIMRQYDLKEYDIEFENILVNNNVEFLTEKYYSLLKRSVDKEYPNAVIPTLFKNLTKCTGLYYEFVLQGSGTHLNNPNTQTTLPEDLMIP